MSTIKAINLVHPSGSTGIAMDTSGNATVAGSMVASSSYAWRNPIINGDFRFNQRGGTNSTINTYALDRWRSFGGPLGFTISQQDSIATYSPARYALRFQRTAGNTQTNSTGVVQGIESQNSYFLRGQNVTISFRARRGANFSSASNVLNVSVFTGTGNDENPVSMTGQTQPINTNVTLGTSLSSFSVTGTLASNITQVTLGFQYVPSGTAGADDWFEITDVQLEVGTVATPFERRDYGRELILCQRYYEQSPALSGYANTTTVVAFNATHTQGRSYFVRKRASPTVVLYSRNGTAAKISSVNTGSDVTGSFAINDGCSDSFHMIASASNALTAGQGYEFAYTASAEL